ncbi:uncharacterized protein LOC123707692 [Pieris brassicae]|uniref:Uncharacterized protein n=1 Tax=Pieris brassicae TaxID=7116 RepID=A0A9P0T9I0_PIEBR|nr:uncharacterized protein LOC123707692 [Pieris brassicae]XP_045513925.1 uncharacterized protein LOC123707692 [Pieris brassicae]XP_045513926.1 uncharacterized protein LOC123707692 [Pieris brassicae]CAH4019169.1 unnamed protein product [Pieris brassicae]
MKPVWNLLFLVTLWSAVQSSPFDDGKYKPKTYDEYDDGKYYRPLTEGKYVPGDEGKYVYIYQQGVFPYDGTYKHLGRGDSNDYIGFQIYAPRFQYIHRIIKELISKYVSPDILMFSGSESGKVNYFDNARKPQEVAMKCNIIDPETRNSTETEVVMQYPPSMKLQEGENTGTLYSFKGIKLLNNEENSVKTKLKLHYEVFLRVVEETE